MDKPSIKKILIQYFASSLSVEGFESNKLIIYTSSATISGCPVMENSVSNEDKPADNSTDLLVYLTQKITDDYFDEYGDGPTPGNDGYIILKDAVFRPGGSNETTQTPFLVVFFDQIIGVTIGILNNG